MNTAIAFSSDFHVRIFIGCSISAHFIWLCTEPRANLPAKSTCRGDHGDHVVVLSMESGKSLEKDQTCLCLIKSSIHDASISFYFFNLLSVSCWETISSTGMTVFLWIPSA